jgi:aldose 1-epimerase
MTHNLFGTLPDGTPVRIYTIKSERVTAKILNLGGILQSLIVDGVDIVCGYDTVEDYLADDSHQGRLIGRVGNRTKNGEFVLNGKTYTLAKNDGGKHHLHGGPCGFGTKVWEIEEADDAHITLSLLSPDGDEGYPGNLFVKVTYAVFDDALTIAYNATCDADTPINLTNHSYFNLGGVGSGDILSYRVQVNADKITAVNDELIPTGERPSVEGTPFDFRATRTFGERLDESFTGYDHNFIFAGAPIGEVADIELPHVATFASDTLTMEVYTDQPGAQIYTGNFLSGKPDFKGGVERLPRHAFCFETQNEPDYLRLGGEPLRAGELYHTVTAFRFVK